MTTIETKLANGVMEVLLHRPDCHNAMSQEMIKELTEVFSRPDKDKSIRAVRLSGHGNSFCSGADLNYMKSMAGFSFEENRQDAGRLFDMFAAVRHCAVPVLTHVFGNVMGGASGLAAASDFVVAESTTRFCFSEVKLGLVPAVISPFILARMESGLARELMLTGRLFDADEALAGKLVHFVGDRSACLARLTTFEKDLLSAGHEAVRETKRLLNRVSESLSWLESRSETTRVIAERRVSAEGQEGIKAFFDKRQPAWRSGKS